MSLHFYQVRYRHVPELRKLLFPNSLSNPLFLLCLGVRSFHRFYTFRYVAVFPTLRVHKGALSCRLHMPFETSQSELISRVMRAFTCAPQVPAKSRHPRRFSLLRQAIWRLFARSDNHSYAF